MCYYSTAQLATSNLESTINSSQYFGLLIVGSNVKPQYRGLRVAGGYHRNRNIAGCGLQEGTVETAIFFVADCGGSVEKNRNIVGCWLHVLSKASSYVSNPQYQYFFRIGIRTNTKI